MKRARYVTDEEKSKKHNEFIKRIRAVAFKNGFVLQHGMADDIDAHYRKIMMPGAWDHVGNHPDTTLWGYIESYLFAPHLQGEIVIEDLEESPKKFSTGNSAIKKRIEQEE